MAAVFGSANMATQLSKGNLTLAQDMIGTSPALRANAGGNSQNGHIGANEDQHVTPPERAAQIAAQDCPALDSNMAEIDWDIPTGVWSSPGP